MAVHIDNIEIAAEALLRVEDPILPCSKIESVEVCLEQSFTVP
jgi:hypothetical protein